jgi:ribose 5-phosphate isomerase B
VGAEDVPATPVSSTRVVFAADDRNECVDAVRAFVDEHYELVTLPGGSPWPEMAAALGRVVSAGDADLGVVMCWTGTGTAIAANTVPGVRAAQASEAWIARGARRWNDANVLAMSLKRTAPDVAVECVRAFVETTEVDDDERERIAELKRLDGPPA